MAVLVPSTNRSKTSYIREVTPGTTLKQILEHRIAKGFLAGRNSDELLKSMLNRTPGKKAAQYTNSLHDGRCITVSVQPMADGGTVMSPSPPKSNELPLPALSRLPLSVSVFSSERITDEDAAVMLPAKELFPLTFWVPAERLRPATASSWALLGRAVWACITPTCL